MTFSNMESIRQKFPDYDDLSDQQLADKLHSKFYSDMDKDSFYKKIGINEKQKNNNYHDQLSYVIGANRTPVDTFRDAAQGLLTGLGKGGQFIAKSLIGEKAPQVDMDEMFSKIGSPNKSMGGDLVKGISEYAPYGLAGGSSLLGQTLSGGAYGAATAKPGEENLGGILPGGDTGGAIKGALLNALTHGAFTGLESLRPSRLFRGNLSPGELNKNLEATQGTRTNVGDVIGSPFLKRQYENVLPRIPFSGADSVMQSTANQIKQKGKDILNELGKDLPESNQSIALQDALKKASKEARQEKNENYSNLNKIADNANLTIGRSNFSNAAKESLNEIMESPELVREFSPEILSDLKEYASNNKGNSLKLTNIFKGKIGEKANNSFHNGNMYEFNILKKLQDSLGEDIEQDINSSGRKDIMDEYNKSQKNYKEKFLPFENPDITKFTRKGGDPDLLLSHFIKPGKNDRSLLISKLVSNLKNEDKNLPLHMYLSRSIEDGQVNPMKLRSLYNKLGDKQKDILVRDKNLRKTLDNYSNLVSKNTEAFHTMFNPKTGQRNIDSGIQLIQGLGGFSAGGIKGALAALLLPGLASKLLVKGMTSPSVRESLVKSIIENKRWNKNLIPALQAGVQNG